MPGSASSIIETLGSFFAGTDLPLKGVYLYGSAGTPFETAGSDMDIAVLAEKRLGFQVLNELKVALERHLGRDVDLIDMHEVSTVMQFQVVTYGKRILTFDRPYCELFDSKTWWLYYDLQEERAGILEDVRKRGKIHD